MAADRFLISTPSESGRVSPVRISLSDNVLVPRVRWGTRTTWVANSGGARLPGIRIFSVRMVSSVKINAQVLITIFRLQFPTLYVSHNSVSLWAATIYIYIYIYIYIHTHTHTHTYTIYTYTSNVCIGMILTWYVNTPWCEVFINKVFSTFPTTRARKTTSNDVFPPGRIIYRGTLKKGLVIAVLRKPINTM